MAKAKETEHTTNDLRSIVAQQSESIKRLEAEIKELKKTNGPVPLTEAQVETIVKGQLAGIKIEVNPVALKAFDETVAKRCNAERRHTDDMKAELDKKLKEQKDAQNNLATRLTAVENKLEKPNKLKLSAEAIIRELWEEGASVGAWLSSLKAGLRSFLRLLASLLLTIARVGMLGFSIILISFQLVARLLIVVKDLLKSEDAKGFGRQLLGLIALFGAIVLIIFMFYLAWPSQTHALFG